MHRTQHLDFKRPDPGRVNLDEIIGRVPSQATVKGLFMESLLRQVPAAERPDILSIARITFRRFTGFHDYPYCDLLRLVRVLARLQYPELPEGEGIRRLCTPFYATFAETIAGRVVFGILGRNARRIMPLGSKGWGICVGMGRVESETLVENHVRYHFHDFAGAFEAVELGVIEGALRFCSVEGEVRIARIDPYNVVFDITWR